MSVSVHISLRSGPLA